MPIYGSLGIYEGLGNLLQRGLELPDGMTEAYVANHTRAILDMLYGTLHRHGKIYNLIGAATDWLDTLEQGAFLLDQAELLLPHFPGRPGQELQTWIDGEWKQVREDFGVRYMAMPPRGSGTRGRHIRKPQSNISPDPGTAS